MEYGVQGVRADTVQSGPTRWPARRSSRLSASTRIRQRFPSAVATTKGPSGPAKAVSVSPPRRCRVRPEGAASGPAVQNVRIDELDQLAHRGQVMTI